MTKVELKQRIEELKREKGAVILAHYYTSDDVQEVADFLGDSLALSVKARDIDAPIILFAGVNFMAETAKVLSPDKKVLLPVPEAGCSLAESCEAAAFAEFKAKYPDHKVVSYVNTSVGVKALTDVCCTSTNALKVVESIPREQPIPSMKAVPREAVITLALVSSVIMVSFHSLSNLKKCPANCGKTSIAASRCIYLKNYSMQTYVCQPKNTAILR